MNIWMWWMESCKQPGLRKPYTFVMHILHHICVEMTRNIMQLSIVAAMCFIDGNHSFSNQPFLQGTNLQEAVFPESGIINQPDFAHRFCPVSSPRDAQRTVSRHLSIEWATHFSKVKMFTYFIHFMWIYQKTVSG